MADRLSEAKARRVYLVLRDAITSGAVTPGTKLPNENALADKHGVSRVTVRRALAELARERLIDRRRSAGTRVVYQPSQAPIVADIGGVLANLAEMGRRTTVELLSFGYVPAAGTAGSALKSGKNDMLQRSIRVRALDGLRFSYLIAHVPGYIASSFNARDLARRPLLELLERAGIKLDCATQRISASLATPEIAAALKVKIGSPLITLERVVYDHKGRGVEHLQAYYRPDRFSIEIDLVHARGQALQRWSPVQRRKRRTDNHSCPASIQ